MEWSSRQVWSKSFRRMPAPARVGCARNLTVRPELGPARMDLTAFQPVRARATPLRQVRLESGRRAIP